MGTLPIPVVDGWGAAAILPLAVLLGIVALAAIPYAYAISRAPAIRPPLLLVALAAALGLGLSAPVLFSNDVYAYLAYGERALHFCDPWGATTTCNTGPLARLAQIAWHHDPPRLVYGPAFVAVAALVAPLGAVDPRAALLAWRLGISVAFLFAVARIARVFGTRAAVIVGANPLALWTVAEGHNDALMLLAATFAFGATRRDRPLAWVIAGAIKGIALIPALWNLHALRTRALVLAAALASYLPLIIDVARGGGIRSSTTVAYDLASLIPLPHLAAQALVALVLGALFLMKAPREERIPRSVLLLWCLLPNAYPWYALWILPFAAVFWGTPAAGALVVAATVSIVRYIPDAAIGNDPALRSSIILMQFMPPIAILAATRLYRKPAAIAAVTLLCALTGCAKTEPAPQMATPPTQSGAPSATAPAASQFSYVLTPQTQANAPAGSPRILEIALNAQTLISPGPILVRITTTTDVVNVIARALGREINIQQASPGIFSGGEDIPRVPAFMRRSYEVEIVAANAEGKTAKATVPVTLR
jgi:hypothetical protein